MAAMKALLGQGDIPKPKRNFLKENVKKVKEMKTEKLERITTQKNKPFQPLVERKNNQHSRSSQKQPDSRRGIILSPLHRQKEFINKKSNTIDSEEASTIEKLPKGYRNQGCQTLTSKQLDNIYHEGTIRYPSVRLKEIEDTKTRQTRNVREMALQTDRDAPDLLPPDSQESVVNWVQDVNYNDESDEAKDYVKMNSTIPEANRVRKPESERFPARPDPTRAPASYQRGVVPKYLKEHRKEQERERIIKAKEVADDCPEGHILLPDDIRQKHLVTLKQNYGDLVSQLNQLPVSTDSLRTRLRKKQIETDLDKIESAIALFSREKVFVQADS